MSETFVLPPSVVSKGDIARLVNEAEWVDAALTEASVRRKVGVESQDLPAVSGLFSDFLETNNISLEQNASRRELIKQLRQLKDEVPIVHITFAVTPDPDSLQQLAGWLRAEIHPQIVIDIGLQPDLVAGVAVRTSNRVFDFSLRSRFANYKEALGAALGAVRG